MIVRGQLVLNINLKKKDEIIKAQSLLNSILEEHIEQESIYKQTQREREQYRASHLANAANILANFPKRHSISADKQKEKEDLVKKMTGKTADQLVRSERAAGFALKRKRDKKTGHFLPGTIKK